MRQRVKLICLLLSLVIVSIVFVSIAHAQDSYTIDPTPWDGVSVADSFALGDGTKDRPYVIASAAQLAYFKELITTKNATPGDYYILGADIDLNEQEWTPIGPTVRTDEEGFGSFSGTFDGRGHTIKGLWLFAVSKSCVGMFGRVSDPETTIQNIVFENCKIEATKSGAYVGVVAGWLQGGKISGITVSESCEVWITNTSAGGIAGRVVGADALVEFCVNSAPITVSGSSDTSSSGGICGVVGGGGTVRYCVNNGEVLSSGSASSVGAGGIAGMMGATTGGLIENCYNTGKITSDLRAGGIAGYNSTDAEPLNTIKNSYNVSYDITGAADLHGQIIGYIARIMDAAGCVGLAGQEIQQYGSIGTAVSGQDVAGLSGSAADQIWTYCDAIDSAINNELLRLNNIVYYEGGLETSEFIPPETTPVETTPDETTPDKTTPVETTPDETTPDGDTTDATTPDATTPGKIDDKKGCGSSISIVFLPLSLTVGAALTFRKERRKD